jgi:ABC-type sugar transport system permease subunit
MKALRMEEHVFPRAMITPTLIVLLVMTAYPLIFTLIYSFYRL